MTPHCFRLLKRRTRIVAESKVTSALNADFITLGLGIRLPLGLLAQAGTWTKVKRQVSGSDLSGNVFQNWRISLQEEPAQTTM